MLDSIVLKKIRLFEQKKLNKSNSELFKNIIKYLQNRFLSSYEKEEILHQILDIILQSQINDKKADILIGYNYEDFCDAIIEEYNSCKSTAYKILTYVKKYLLYFMFALGITYISIVLIHQDYKVYIPAFTIVFFNAFAINFALLVNVKKHISYRSIFGKYKIRICEYKGNESVRQLIYFFALILPIFVIVPFIVDDTLNINNILTFFICSFIFMGIIDFYKVNSSKK